jgi:hypothetical protein
MPSECRFGDDGTKAARFYKPDNNDDQRNENDEDVGRPGIVSKSQKAAEFRPIFVIRHRHVDFGTVFAYACIG